MQVNVFNLKIVPKTPIWYYCTDESQVYQNYGPPKIEGGKCGAIGKDRRLTTVKCDIPYNFFCEKNTTSLACEDNGEKHSATSKPVEVVTSNYNITTTPINKPVKSSATAYAVDGLILIVFMSLISFISL